MTTRRRSADLLDAAESLGAARKRGRPAPLPAPPSSEPLASAVLSSSPSLLSAPPHTPPPLAAPLPVPAPVPVKRPLTPPVVKEVPAEVDMLDFEILPLLMEELDDLLPEIDALLAEGAEGVKDPALHRHLHTLKGSLGTAGSLRGRRIAHDLETYLENYSAEGIPLEEAFSFVTARVQDLWHVIASLRTAEPSETQAQEPPAPPFFHASPSTPFKTPAPSVSPDPQEPSAIQDALDEELLPILLEEMDEIWPQVKEMLGSPESIQQSGELHRLVHTLKGALGTAGALRARALAHEMESVMEEVTGGVRALEEAVPELARHAQALDRALQDLRTPTVPAPLQATPLSPPTQISPETRPKVKTPVVPVKTVRVSTVLMDTMLTETSEASLLCANIQEALARLRTSVRQLEEEGDRLAPKLRELELIAEAGVAYQDTTRSQVNEEHSSPDFDVLELDRFSRLHQLSRSVSETVNDIAERRREIVHILADADTFLVNQERALSEVQEGLHITRLTPVDTLHERLHKVVLLAAKEVGKSVHFVLIDNRVELDKALLEKLVPPLEHILRNAVAHGLETPDVRQRSGKTPQGRIEVEIRQSAERATIITRDDGAGLALERIKAKAVEKGLWDAADTMDSRQAADMICAPGFSTAEAVSQIAGRGVGMDVVRSEVLSLGGRFELTSQTHKGLTVTIQVPTTIATASLLVVQSAGMPWALPIEIVEQIVLPTETQQAYARQQGTIDWKDVPGIPDGVMPFAALDRLMGVTSPGIPSPRNPVLLVREGDRWVTVEVDAVLDVVEAPLRPLGPLWHETPGVIGGAVLHDGKAAFLIDPLRAPWEGSQQRRTRVLQPEAPSRPVVMVVDDSLTVRKATARILERAGYLVLHAKHGQEALELLAHSLPSAMLLDVEMPIMDGFDCARHIREHERWSGLPIIMITSRTGEKHRQRAQALGVNAYLGKPFKEDEVLRLLEEFISKPTPSKK